LPERYNLLWQRNIISTFVVFALKEIGKGKVTEAEIQKIMEALSKEKKENIIYDATIAPEWIADIMLKTIKDE